jgi:iron(III) transport system permease protein
MSKASRQAAWVLLAGWVGLVLLPWYGVDGSFSSFVWLRNFFTPSAAPALIQVLVYDRFWLWPVIIAFLLPLVELSSVRNGGAAILIVSGAVGLLVFFLQGFLIGLNGWFVPGFTETLGPIPPQEGMGAGALVAAISLFLLLSLGLARAGAMRGDFFLVSSTTLIAASIVFFVFFPVAKILITAALDADSSYSLSALVARLIDSDIWKLSCLAQGSRCGVVWNSLALAVVTGLTTTLLGLGLALLHKRTGFRPKALLRGLAVLPIITPPFVIGLGIILIFGRTGLVTMAMHEWLAIPPSRWIYGLAGLIIVQTLAFAPIAYLVLIGVVEGISPSMEEAARTLRADESRTFRTVTWPLLRPGLANAFLISFVESLADFGNPLVLGGNFDVLSTDIFFAIVGSQNDPGRAAALAIVLLALTLSAFLLQRQWLGRKSYTTVAGKGDAGKPAPLPQGIKLLVYVTTVPWLAFTFAIYAIILLGGFVHSLGIDNSFTLQHYITAFGVEWTEHGILWAGRAWPSFLTTLELAALAAPPTAAIGLLTAYLLDRQRFIGQTAFEFMTMLSFAIPGTVIGVSYILAFNVPPIELTGTALILVICFIFRNLPVSIRAGIATLAQIDKSLDECSLMLRHSTFATIRRVILPLLRPAIVASLVYSFVRAITSVSAVIFLVSAQYNLATAYIVGRVEISDFGVAIAYSSVLIVLMMLVIGIIQFVVGEQRRPIALRAVPIMKRKQYA